MTAFDRWLADVDRHVEQMVGLSLFDLEDQPFYDWWEGGVSAAQAARRTVRNGLL